MRVQKLLCGLLAVALVAGGCKKRDRDLTTDLHRAAERGDPSQVQALIARGANVNARDDRSRTPLHFAAQNGHREVVEVLVRCGAQVGGEDEWGRTPADVAMARDHRAVVEYLIGECALVTLSQAAYLGDVPRVKSLLGAGAGVNSKMGAAALYYAARQNQRAVAELLIDTGVHVDSFSDGGTAPLHVAAEKGYTEMVQLLVSKGADINLRQDSGETPLHLSLRNGCLDVAKLLISSGADVNAEPAYHETPLSYATEHGFVDTVRDLIANGADVAAIDGDALCKVAEDGRHDILRLLLAAGVNVNLRGRYGWTALHAAVSEREAAIAELLLAKGADVNALGSPYGGDECTPLHLAAGNGDEHMVELLLTKGANVNARSNWGDRPLHDLLGFHRRDGNVWPLAASLGVNLTRGTDPCESVRAAPDEEERERRTRILTVLLEHGADANAVDKGGWTPLHVAVREGYVRSVEVLIDKGAGVNARTSGVSSYLGWEGGGQTPLLLALRGGYLNVAELLVDQGADINMADHSGETPLSCVLHKVHSDVSMLPVYRDLDYRGLHGQDATALQNALRKGYRGWIDRLLAGGAAVNPRDEDGGTPLHYAARTGDRLLAELLLVHGAKVNVADKRGNTPLHQAVLSGYRDIVEVLLAHNADLNARNSRGRTPLDEAVLRRHTEIIQLLTAKAAGTRAGVQEAGTRE